MSIKNKIFIAMKNEIPKKKLHWYIGTCTQKHIQWLYEEKCTVFISDIIKKANIEWNIIWQREGDKNEKVERREETRALLTVPF